MWSSIPQPSGWLSSASTYFVGWLPKIMLQLHYSLTIMVEGIRIIDGAANWMSIVLETVVFNPRGLFLGQCCLKEKKASDRCRYHSNRSWN